MFEINTDENLLNTLKLHAFDVIKPDKDTR